MATLINKKIWAVVKFQFEGIHFYKDAPDEVSFLRHPHRHIFHCEVWLQQFHEDRDIEYIMLKKDLQTKFTGGDLGKMSCEMIAEEIAKYLAEQYCSILVKRKIKVFVSEDNENGCCIEYKTT